MANIKTIFLATVIVFVVVIGLMLLTLMQNTGNSVIMSRRSLYNDGSRRFVRKNQTRTKVCDDCGNNVALSLLNVSKGNVYDFFSGSYLFDKPPLNSWVTPGNTWKLCDNRVEVYSDLFGILHDVVLFPRRRAEPDNVAKGGEEIRDVIPVLNSGYKQIYSFNQDTLEMNCNSQADIGSRQLHWLKYLKLNSVKNGDLDKMPFDLEDKYVIAVSRGDYANLHNWMRNIFNTFLMMMFFKVQPRNVQVLFMDGHPLAQLDKAWDVIYGPVIRVGRIQEPKRFKHLVLNFAEHKGPASEFRNTEVPYIEEFRSFLLSQFQLSTTANLNCSSLKITILFRRDVVDHPGRLTGMIGRKIFNEATLVNDLMLEFPTACIKPVVMDTLPMRSQLEIISQSDVLIGMHGAGMTHVMFLPQHAALLELFPKDFKVNRPWYECFHSITKWRGMKYESWENFDSNQEMPHDYTILPTQFIAKKTRSLVDKLCST